MFGSVVVTRFGLLDGVAAGDPHDATIVASRKDSNTAG
jgi:hypothetical protein